MKLIKVDYSPLKTKKYQATFQDDNKTKTVHFGAKGYSDFTLHGDEARKTRYLNRHREKEDWNNPMTAGALSRWILWNKPTLEASIADFKKRFHL